MYADGSTGVVYIDPDEDILKEADEKLRLQKEDDLKLSAFIGKPTVTKGGRKIMMFANITRPSDIDAVLENDAEGIGLFRSEFMYMDRRTLPSEDELYSVYSSIAEKMGNKPIKKLTVSPWKTKKTPPWDCAP